LILRDLHKLYLYSGVLLVCLLAAQPGYSQVIIDIPETTMSVEHDSTERLPGTTLEWTGELLPDANTAKMADAGSGIRYRFQAEMRLPFTGLAVGWKTSSMEENAGEFRVSIKSSTGSEDWSSPVTVPGYLNPDDSPSGLYWAMLYVTADGEADTVLEAEIRVPEGSVLTYATIRASDARADSPEQKPRNAGQGGEPYVTQTAENMPEIRFRNDWWGNLPPGELEPSYTPVQIDITHAAVHHTVTANEPPDPRQVIRQIWDWHVNDNGWNDIGYNFLVDHEGKIYQGRYNPWLDQTDVQGAHAGNSNSRSVGIALLGQFEPGVNPQPGNPADPALNALVQTLSWRFGQKGIDPLGQGSIPVNPSGSRVLPAIFGHRDVSATACPGENLYTLLPQIRVETANQTGETGDPDDEFLVPEAPFTLMQNYPNPFQAGTTIPFELGEELEVRIDLYSVRGERIRNIFTGTLPQGEHDVEADLSGLASGVYYYELDAGGFRQMKQMVYFR
jgi:hypothetical protein